MSVSTTKIPEVKRADFRKPHINVKQIDVRGSDKTTLVMESVTINLHYFDEDECLGLCDDLGCFLNDRAKYYTYSYLTEANIEDLHLDSYADLVLENVPFKVGVSEDNHDIAQVTVFFDGLDWNWVDDFCRDAVDYIYDYYAEAKDREEQYRIESIAEMEAKLKSDERLVA